MGTTVPSTKLTAVACREILLAPRVPCSGHSLQVPTALGVTMLLSHPAKPKSAFLFRLSLVNFCLSHEFQIFFLTFLKKITEGYTMTISFTTQRPGPSP